MGACLSRPGDLVPVTAVPIPPLNEACHTDALSKGGNALSNNKDDEADKVTADGGEREQVEEVQCMKSWNTKMGLPHQSLFLGPPTPPCEDQRLATVRALGLVDSPPDPELDSILKLIMSIFQAPNALVALFEDRRIFVKEARGAFQRGDFPWRYSFCAWTMAAEQDQVMVIPDATKDARFVDNKFVQAEGGVRFYCGAPLIASNGHRLGCICFADEKARPEFDGMQASIMGNMAEMVVRHVEKDIALQLRTHDNAALTNAYTQLKRAVDCFEHCVVLLDTSQPNWRIVYTNLAWDKITGCSRDNVRNVDLNEVLELASGELPSAAHRDAVAAEKQVVIEDVMVRTSWLLDAAQGGGGGGTISKQSSRTLFERKSSMSTASQSLLTAGRKKLVLKLRPATKSGIDENALALAVPSFVAANSLKKPADAPRLHLYFMTVEAMEVVKPPTTLLSARGSVTSRNSSSEDGCPVEGLQLGQLLGKGGFGSVYSGSWFGTAVAVKLIDQDMRNMAQQGGVCLEALLGAEMRHPHIVNLLTYVVRRPNNTSTQSFTAFSDDTARTGASNTVASSSVAAPPSPLNFAGTHAPRNLSQAGVSAAASSAYLQQPSASALPVINSGTPAAPEPDALQFEFVAVVPQAPGSTTLSPLSPMLSASKDNSKPAAGVQQLHAGSKADKQAQGEQPTHVEQIKVVCTSDASASGSSGANTAVTNSAAHTSGGYPIPPGTALLPTGFAEVAQHSGDCWSAWGQSAQPQLVDMLSAQTSRGNTTIMGSGTVFSHAQTWIVMEYCDRGCLQDAVDRGWLRTDPSLVHGAVRMEAVLATAHEVASAMLYLHSHNIVHGDLSAWNVLLTTSGTGASVAGRGFVAKVADFGLSRSLDIKTRVQTRTYGTITHQPPETLASGIISRETDTFSLGVLLWQMYTGSRPWVGLNHAQIIMTVASRSARLTFPEGTPEDYAALAYACMSYNAEERPSMAEVCRTLEALKLKYGVCA